MPPRSLSIKQKMQRTRAEGALKEIAGSYGQLAAPQACKSKSTRAERQKVLDELGDALTPGSIVCLAFMEGCRAVLEIREDAMLMVEGLNYPVSPCHIKRGNPTTDS